MADVQVLFLDLKRYFLVLLTLNVSYPSKTRNRFENTCHKRSFRDIYLDVNLRGCAIAGVVIAFKDWKFADESLLVQTFPVDKEMRNYVREVKNAVFSIVHPVPLKSRLHLVAISADALVNILNIDPSSCGENSFAEFAAGNRIVPNATPLSHRYGGHQFGEWAGQLGDGRAVLLGEYINSKGERWELQLKGSGKTPYSRGGDGRAVVRSSVREFLASEAMFHLGIPTTRAASLVISDNLVWRDQFYDGHPRQERAAVVLRLAPTWFRIGSLEILQHHGEIDTLRKVVDFMINNYFPSVSRGPSKYLDFFSEVVKQTAEMIAKWQAVGFAHGVCNTDNFSLLSVTIDYGPFGFMDEYNPGFVPNTSDEEARYSYRNQPSIGYYNLGKLLHALKSLVKNDDRAQEILRSYVEIFNTRFLELFRKKLGLLGERSDDEMLIKSLLWLMEVTRADFTMTFRELGDLSLEHIKTNTISPKSWAIKKLQTHKNWADWLNRYSERIQWNVDDTDRKRRSRMHGVNPRYVLRNWMAQSAIGKVENNDFSEVQRLQDVLENPFTEQVIAEDSGYASPPPLWASHLRVSCSS